jgi:hypothetical protein
MNFITDMIKIALAFFLAKLLWRAAIVVFGFIIIKWELYDHFITYN